MSHTFTVTVSDTEYKSLQFVAVDPQDWVESAVTSRCQAAGDDIVTAVVAHCNTNNVQLGTGRDAQITQAYDLKVVKTGAAVKAEAEAAAAALAGDGDE
tara:strand:- start:214 stop:510 length:297 start_codon:yes stop_codon:yes gene_type:complete